MKLSIALMTITLLLTSCSQQSSPPPSHPWPPPLSTTQPPTPKSENILKISGGGEGEGWCNLKTDKEGKIFFAMGLIVKEGEANLDFNIFNATKPDGCYFEAGYEVIHLANNSTTIRMTPANGDRIALGYKDKTFYPLSIGTRVRYESKTYEVRSDGWYCDGILVHSFQ